MKQAILSADDNYKELKDYFIDKNIDNLFIVCSKSLDRFNIYNFLKDLDISITYFTDYTPNPTYESVVLGIDLFRKSGADTILAVGGGSAMDVAKAIKLFATMDDTINYLQQEEVENDIRLMAIPTTAGTGSEATRFSVIYYNGEKQSIAHDSLIPSAVLFDSTMIESLPLFQKKVTMLDALSHSIESYWSVNSTDESKNYSKEAIEIILKYMDDYLNGNIEANKYMLLASNLAGKAINITQTTAGHAMCYKLTSLYGIPHGQATALINSVLLPFMMNNTNKCIDQRGEEYLKNTFEELRSIMHFDSSEQLETFLDNLLCKLDLYDVEVDKEDVDMLVNSVNETRLKNNPVGLTKEDITTIYSNLINKIEKRKENGSRKIC